MKTKPLEQGDNLSDVALPFLPRIKSLTSLMKISEMGEKSMQTDDMPSNIDVNHWEINENHWAWMPKIDEHTMKII